MTLWATLRVPPVVPLTEGDNQFALIDAAQVERLTDKLPRDGLVLAVESLFGRPIAPAKASATPHLVAVAGLSAWGGVVRALSDATESHGALGWLVSPLSALELAQRLRARLDARLPDRFDCVNRYFDGRVTPHLHECLEADQRRVFFSVCSQWWVVDHTHQWRSLSCSFASDDAFVPPLALDERQQAHLIDACYPYAVIEHFMQTDQELLETVPATQRYAFFRSALQAAEQFGIDGGPSGILFCTLALTRGPGFHQQPRWRAALDQVKAGTLTLRQAIKAEHHD
ncbi:DUF4123 domain-containing protein [Salinibacterium sp.]|uniref:DUF4123 domain-containing protein n=1 Tax=Salinibacterium sp. TaxID=1915057 RepID=UPI00286CB92F|nr:DUF4123 domain-containing protein [Salinibacterium sp.]